MTKTLSRRRLALAISAALAATAAGPAGSAVVITGPYVSQPGGAAFVSGPNVLLPGTEIWFGTGALASLTADAGSQVSLGSLYLGQSHAAAVTLDGAGTVLRLNSPGDKARLTIGAGAAASLSVLGGALLDGRDQAANCLSSHRFCGTFIGDATGAAGELLVAGTGSEARLQGPLTLGNAGVGENGFGVPGGTARGEVSVIAAGLLRTYQVQAGVTRATVGGNGNERSVAQVTVQGAGSRWQVEANPIDGADALADFASGARATATLAVASGGRFEVLGDPGRNYGARLGAGGTFAGSVTGSNAALWLTGDASQGYLHLAEGGGTARLDVTAGGAIGGARWVQVGMNGGNATLNLDAGSADFTHGDVQVGNGGTGLLAIANGGRLDARQLNVGVNHGGWATPGHGTVTLDGAGSMLTLSAVDTHRLIVGGSGEGTFTVSGGALLDSSQGAAACLGRWCGVRIGQVAGDTARFTVTGTGSEARFLGDFGIGEVFVARQAVEGWNGGQVNGTSRAWVDVLAGGQLVTETVRTGGAVTASQGGGERSFVELAVDGPGSTWLVTGNAAHDAQFTLSENAARRVDTTLAVRNGGLLLVQGQAGRNAGVDLASGGRASVTVQGPSSRLEIAGETSRLVLGNAQGGEARLVVQDGAAVVQRGAAWSHLNIGETNATGRMEILSGGQVSGARSVNVGSGGDGSLLISGAASLLTTERSGSFVGQLNVGPAGTGRLDVLAGGAASVFALQVGNGWDHAARGQVVIDGAGSRVELDAVDWHRLSINGGSVLVSGGALLDGAVNAPACTGHWCGVFVANNAGDDGALTVTGAGSTARFLSSFFVGQAYVTAPPATTWQLGEPGGTSRAQVHVLAGGLLQTQLVSIANGPTGPASTGHESVLAQVRVRGPGSVWQVVGGGGSAASFSSGLGNAANTLTDIQIADGGQLLLTADASTAAFVQLGANGGVNRMSITGPGSRLSYGATVNAGLWVGRNGATASLAVSNGGLIEGLNRLQVGNTGANGSLSVTGAGSRIDYGAGFADLFVGRQGANGVAAITQGGVVSMAAWQPRLFVGSGDGLAGTTGALRLDGAGSLLSLVSPASGAGAFDLPQASIGWGGSGTVDVTGGALLLLNGQGTSTPAQPAITRMTVGQNVNGLNGSGTLNVSGSGSRVSVTGTDAAIYVGRTSGGTGTLNLSAGGALDTTLLDVGLQGGVGALQVNGATLNLTGQHSGSAIGATLGIGLGTGSIGSARLANGSVLTISNPGNQGALLLLGGANSAPGGNGSLVVRASTVQLSGVAGATAAIVGYNGSGLASLENASTLDAGATGGVIVGWKPGSTGTLNVSGGSTVLANYVGVGASPEGEGGVASLIVNDTSSLTATTIEIGSQGYVGGTGTLIGNVVNRGVFNPGNSPGTLHVQGSFANQAGGRLVLEVAADGAGGFVTDQLVFDAGSTLNLGALQIEFRFLGAADPNAFQASGAFQIDSFLRQGNTGLDHALLGGASYTASSGAYQFTSFSFSADGGAVFQAQAVPEPGTWMLFAMGLGLGGWLQRRRRSPC